MEKEEKHPKNFAVSDYCSIFANGILIVAHMDLTHNIIEYVNCCIGAFANRFKLPMAEAYAYLRQFKGIDFLIDCYAAEHTLSIEDAVDDIAQLCQKHGGHLSC